MVTSLGSWDIDGQSYPNVGLSSGEGDPITFSVPKELAENLPAVFSKVKAEVSFEANGNKTRKRLVAWEYA
jgi:hypothetical protein